MTINSTTLTIYILSSNGQILLSSPMDLTAYLQKNTNVYYSKYNTLVNIKLTSVQTQNQTFAFYSFLIAGTSDAIIEIGFSVNPTTNTYN